MARPKGIPGYLHHKASGRAFVRINGTDIYLGFHGSKESKDEYDRIIREWLANGRNLPKNCNQQQSVTVNGICAAFLEHAETYYRKNDRITTEVNKIEIAARLLSEHCGESAAHEFSRQSLKVIRDKMVALNWKRRTINERMGHVKRIFKWAAQESMIPAAVYQELQMLDGLKKGRSTCPESEDILPVPLEDYEKTLPFCPPMIADMARIQFLAAMRPGEVCAMRTCEIDRSGDVWIFDYRDHKTGHHGHFRKIQLGPRAQAVLMPYLIDAADDPDKYLFSPRDSVHLANIEKRKNRKTPVQPSQVSRAKKDPKIGPGNRYEVSSYRRPLQRAAKKAGVEQWFPNQLRHLAATIIRAKYGLEASQVILGHEKADITQIYAERDQKKGASIMWEIG